MWQEDIILVFGTGVISKILLQLVDAIIIVIELNSCYIISEISHTILLINLCNLILILSSYRIVCRKFIVIVFYVSFRVKFVQYLEDYRLSIIWEAITKFYQCWCLSFFQESIIGITICNQHIFQPRIESQNELILSDCRS